MLIVAIIVLVLIPAVAILWPFVRGKADEEYLEDESSPRAELSRRWDAALSGLKNTELEWAIGNLVEEDYRWLRNRYITEAATIMKAMELEEDQESEFLAAIEEEIRQARHRVLGPNGVAPLATCVNCAYDMEQEMEDCPNCGVPLVGQDATATPKPPKRVIDE